MTEREMLIAKANEEVEIQRMLADACEDEGDLEGAADCMKLVILLRNLVAALAQQQEAEPVGVVPQDVEEFIAESAYCTPIRDEYGDTHYETDTIDVNDLRAWMTGHVRVPVELIENTLGAVREELSKAHNAAYLVCCGRSGSECCGSPEPEWPVHAMKIMDTLGSVERNLSALLNASKEKQ